MSDSKRYIERRKKRDKGFAHNFDTGFRDFKLGVTLRELRVKKGITQEVLAKKLETKKSAISRLENHAEDMRISTLEKYLSALGKELRIQIA